MPGHPPAEWSRHRVSSPGRSDSTRLVVPSPAGASRRLSQSRNADGSGADRDSRQRGHGRRCDRFNVAWSPDWRLNLVHRPGRARPTKQACTWSIPTEPGERREREYRARRRGVAPVMGARPKRVAPLLGGPVGGISSSTSPPAARRASRTSSRDVAYMVTRGAAIAGGTRVRRRRQDRLLAGTPARVTHRSGR